MRYTQQFLSVDIFEIFPGTGYENNKVCPEDHAKSLKRENYWLKTLRTIYPYDLNERARRYDSEVPVEKLFFSIPRTKQRSARSRNDNDYLKKWHRFFSKYSQHHSKRH